MGESTGIAWTDSTINVWHGCHKVSQGCAHCYAEVSTPVRVKRAAGLEVWGATAARSETKGWEASLRKWNKHAARFAAPNVHRVFGQSLSDTFEDYQGDDVRHASGLRHPNLDFLRAWFFHVIKECPALTFQLLTKRPENVCRMVPPSWLASWPAHVWIGCTVEDQENAERRIPHLLAIPAPVRFLSVEPQIGPVKLRSHLMSGESPAACVCDHGHGFTRCPNYGGVAKECHRHGCGCRAFVPVAPALAWVIQGGESGSKARAFDLAWMFDMKAQCAAAGIPWFPKQAGARPVYDGIPVEMSDSHGADESEWPTALRGCRAFPEARP